MTIKTSKNKYILYSTCNVAVIKNIHTKTENKCKHLKALLYFYAWFITPTSRLTGIWDSRVCGVSYCLRTEWMRMSGTDTGWAGVNERDNRCRPGRKERKDLLSWWTDGPTDYDSDFEKSGDLRRQRERKCVRAGRE